MPVTNPDLAERKQRRLVRNNLVTDPVGLAEPLYQLRHRDEIVAPSPSPSQPPAERGRHQQGAPARRG